MDRTRVIGVAGVAALVVAAAIAFLPTHAEVGLRTIGCGSALKPVNAMDDYDVLADPTGMGMTAAQLAEDRCEAARSAPAYTARVFGFAGVACLLVAAGKRVPRKRRTG